MSGWENSDRRSRLPKDWPQRVRDVKKRAGGRCEWHLPVSGKRCPRKGTDVDHKQNDDNHDLRNLQLLCPAHHQRKTVREAWRGKQRRKPRPKPQERHPGLRRTK